MFWVYMLECADHSFYVGHTDNLNTRLWQHQQGAIDHCYTFSRRPVTLVFSQAFPSRLEALVAERQLKGWSRAKKTALIAGDWQLLTKLSRNRQRE